MLASSAAHALPAQAAQLGIVLAPSGGLAPPRFPAPPPCNATGGLQWTDSRKLLEAAIGMEQLGTIHEDVQVWHEIVMLTPLEHKL